MPLSQNTPVTKGFDEDRTQSGHFVIFSDIDLAHINLDYAFIAQSHDGEHLL